MMKPHPGLTWPLPLLAALAILGWPHCLQAQTGLTDRVHIDVYVDGRTKRYSVAPGLTVGQVLAETGVRLGPHDRVQPSPRTTVFEKLSVAVFRVTVRTVDESVHVPYDVIIVEDPSLRKGLVRLQDKSWCDGHSRERVRYYEQDNGVRERIVLEADAATTMRPKRIVIGTKGAQPSRASGLPGREIEMQATAYAPHPDDCGPDFATTSTGLPAGRGIVAVDPNVIPYGTKMYIEGYGWAVAGDTGGAIRGYRIDLCFDARAEALEYGTRPVKVRLFE